MSNTRIFVGAILLNIWLGPLSSTLPIEAGVAYPDPSGGWDLVYGGDDATFGTTFDTLDKNFQGNWRRDQSSRWDGSAPGTLGDPAQDPASASPGGLDVLVEQSTTFLRIQDTGEPRQVQPSGATQAWDDPSNRRFLFGHDIQKEHPGITDVLTNGITLSFRARIASTGQLDPVYPDFADGEPEYPNWTDITPWPAGGKGYNVTDSAKGMFTVSENGRAGVGFSLALDSDTPGGDDGLDNGTVIPPEFGGDGINVGGGLIMNNQPPGGVLGLPGTDRATAASANVLSIPDQDLLNWHEFWITVEDANADGHYEVDVYQDGVLTPASFLAKKSNGVEYPGQYVSFGLPSTTSWGAVDVDFVAYKLGRNVPVPEPSAVVLVTWCAIGLLMHRRFRAKFAG